VVWRQRWAITLNVMKYRGWRAWRVTFTLYQRHTAAHMQYIAMLARASCGNIPRDISLYRKNARASPAAKRNWRGMAGMGCRACPARTGIGGAA
jgi:hypothetical protein